MELEYYRKYEPIFGEYYIKKELGEGSSGKVFEIEREDIAGTFHAALKAISIPKNQSQLDMISAQHKDPSAYYTQLASELQTEVELMAELKGHTNIVSYENHKFIQHDDGIGWDILIQMELLIPLYRYAAVHEISEKDVIDLGIDICSALEICHDHNIIHRDVKPENIFVTMDGNYKLGDFGIARIFEETRSGTRIGTDSFMAPEVFNYRKYGTSVDIYSLGIVMYTLLNDHRIPFEMQTQANTRGKRLEANNRRMMGEKLPPPAYASRELSEIILKAAQYEVEDRYRSAGDMKKDLLRLRDSSEIAMEPVTRKKKSPVKKVLAAGLALIVAAAGIFALVPKEISDITGIENQVTILYGDTLSPEYEIEPKRFSDEKIAFKMSDKSIASVSESGEIEAEQVGKTELLITAMDYEKKVSVVVEPKIEKISGLKEEYILTSGDTLALHPVLHPEKYQNEKISYKAGDEAVLSVNKSGTVTAKDPGKSRLVISSGGFKKTIDITVEAAVQEPVEVQEEQTYEPAPAKKSEENSQKSSNAKKETAKKKSSSDENLSWGDDDSLGWE